MTTTPRYLLLAAIVMVGGCGDGRPPTYRAGGTVTFRDGRPVTDGWVAFQLVDADRRLSARGQIQPDGTFDVFVSVGQRDGTPKIALPLDNADGHRRYRLGRVQIVSH
jgi:hypothetical protein